jgi:hypothetical protein
VFATWTSLLLLLLIHLFTNYRAVRAVKMHSLNRQRANIVFSTLVDKDVVLTPEQVAQHERIFERDGVLRWKASDILGHCKIGISLKGMLDSISHSEAATGAFRGVDSQIRSLIDLYRHEEYVLWYDRYHRQAYIILKGGVSTTSMLKAWSHALVLAREANSAKTHYDDGDESVAMTSQEKVVSGVTGTRQFQQTMSLLQKTLVEFSPLFDTYPQRLKAAGWDLDTAVLETTPGHRSAFVVD